MEGGPSSESDYTQIFEVMVSNSKKKDKTHHHGVLVFKNPVFMPDAPVSTSLLLWNLNDFNGHPLEMVVGAVISTYKKTHNQLKN